MRNDVILACKYVARHTLFGVQASYCGHCTDEGVNEFEERAYDLIAHCTDADLDEAFDECVENGMDEAEVTYVDVLRVVGDRAETPYESLMLDTVHIIMDT